MSRFKLPVNFGGQRRHKILAPRVFPFHWWFLYEMKAIGVNILKNMNLIQFEFFTMSFFAHLCPKTGIFQHFRVKWI